MSETLLMLFRRVRIIFDAKPRLELSYSKDFVVSLFSFVLISRRYDTCKWLLSHYLKTTRRMSSFRHFGTNRMV